MISEYFSTINITIGEKFPAIPSSIASSVSGFSIGLYYGTSYAFICVAYIIIIFAVIGAFARSVKKAAIDKLCVLKELGGAIEETFGAIKVVITNGRE